MRDGIRDIVFAFLLLFTLMIIGVGGFVVLEGFTLVDAFYMTTLIVSTVGFGEVEPLSEAGKIFTSVYMILNLSILAYIVTLISKYFFEGEFKKVFTTLMFNQKRYKKLKNHIIVVGYGRTGAKVCDELLKSNQKFILIESNEKALKFVPRNPPFPVIVDDATSEEILISAGVASAKSLIITSSNDANNMLITITAKGLNNDLYIVARASEESAEKKLYRAGATKVVKPFALGGIHLAHLITQPYVIEFLEILTGMTHQDLKLEEFKFDQLKDEYKNKTISELDIHRNTGATVVGFKDHEQGFQFDTRNIGVIEDGDILIILGSEKCIEKFSMYCK